MNDAPFVVHAVDRVEHYIELMSVDEEDLGLVLAPCLRQYDDIASGELLDEEDQGFEVDIHGRDVDTLRDSDVDASYDFDAVIEFDYNDLDVEEFVDVEFRTWISVFEEEFPERNYTILIRTTTINLRGLRGARSSVLGRSLPSAEA